MTSHSNAIRCVNCSATFPAYVIRSDRDRGMIAYAFIARGFRRANGGYACSEACKVSVARDITPPSRAQHGKIVSGVSG